MCHCEISFDFGEFRPVRWKGRKLAEIGWNFAETQRKEYTRLQFCLFQFTSRYSLEIQVFILYHSNPIQTDLIRHPVAWATCDMDLIQGRTYNIPRIVHYILFRCRAAISIVTVKKQNGSFKIKLSGHDSLHNMEYAYPVSEEDKSKLQE